MIKWGIIGLGNMGQKFASAIKETSNSEIVGIATVSYTHLTLPTRLMV